MDFPPPQPEQSQAESHQKTIAELLEHLKGTEVNISDFKFLSKVGGGATSEVIQALHKKTGIICAVKKFKNEELEGIEAKTFCREAKILAKCRNFFLIPFYGVSFHSPYIIVTKYIKNGNLRDALHHVDPTVPHLTSSNKTIIAFGIAAGMQYLHDHGVVHRDLKTLNILLDGKLLPHIGDFGLSRVTNEATGIMTQKVGTPSWMAPEVFTSAEYTNKVDIYSFGIILWEMLTGEKPFAKMNAAQLAIAVCQRGERPPLPKDCPEKLKNLIQSCWNQDPERRPRFTDIMNSIRRGKCWYPGTVEDDLDSFFETFDSDHFNKKGKKSSPFLKQVKSSKLKSNMPGEKGRMKKAASYVQRRPSKVTSPKKNGEEEDVPDITNLDIPDFKVSEVDVSYATTRIKKLQSRKLSSFDFDDFPEPVPETSSILKPPALIHTTEEPEYDPMSKKSLLHQSQVHGSHFMPPAFISTFHAKIEESSDDAEEEDQNENENVKQKKSSPKDKKRASLNIAPPSVSTFEMADDITPAENCELGMLPPILDFETQPMESTVKPVPLVFTTTSGDRPKVSDIPVSPYVVDLQPVNPLPDPLTYQYEVKPIPKPSVFVEPKPPEYDEEGKKINPFISMEAPESRGRTVFGRTNADVLLDYQRPTFENTFLRTMWQLTRFNAKDFFSCISVLFTPPVPYYISQMVLRHCLRCLDMNQNAWKPFANSDAATSLPFATQCLFNLSARIFLYVIPMNPAAMTPEITRQLLAMASFKVHQVLRIFSVYVANIRFISDPWPVLDALLDASLYIIENGGAIGLIRILYHLLKKVELFQQQNEEKCLKIFAQALYTIDFEAAAVAFSAICGVNNNPIELPKDIIAFHLKYPDMRPFAISYLAMRGSVPFDTDIVNGILSAAKTSEVAAMLLCRVAESTEGAKMLAKSTVWMDDGYLALDNAIRIFALIFKVPELKATLADSQYFETFLNRLVTSSQNRYIAAAAYIVAKLQLTFAIVERMRSHNFLSRFFTVTTVATDPTVIKGTLLAVKKICSIEYCEEMALFIENWGSLITAEGEYVDDALEIAAKLTEYQEGVAEFRKLDVPAILEKTYVCERSTNNRDLLLSRISS